VDPFAALADPVRRELLRALTAGPARVVDLAAAHPISRPAVSKHLRLLTEAGLATVEDRGRERHYALAPAGLAPVRGLLDELADRLAEQRAPIPESVFDGLDLEVRRTVRDRRTDRADQADQADQTPDVQEDTA
jgi:DNA-binding transcriptional ArsR family regulator